MFLSLNFRLVNFLILLSFSFSCLAQDEDKGLLFKDHIYLQNIRTVTLHPMNNPIGYPILRLNASNEITFDTLILGFDDLAEDISSYVYTVQLCDKNWKPANMSSGEYISGYENENIDNYEAAASTITPYIHYELRIPNENFTLKESGNYLLKVYEDEDERRLAFTKRFFIVKPTFELQSEFVPTFDINKRNTHREISFLLDHKNQTITNPIATISATVLQNYRWDTAIENVPPNLLKDEKVIFNYRDKFVFDGLREFRQLDNRSFNDRSMEVQKIERFSDGFLVNQKPEKKRSFTVYNNVGSDINGFFYIQNLDDREDENVGDYEIRKRQLLRQNQPYNFLDPIHKHAGDYSINQFKLEYPEEIENADVYIYGGFTNYELNDEFKMTYNSERSRYEGTCLLKQGYYEYYYVVVDRDKATLDLQVMEPNLFETENEYLILIYHTPFGARNDQLIRIQRLSSTKYGN